jgi:hypothetical protein
MHNVIIVSLSFLRQTFDAKNVDNVEQGNTIQRDILRLINPRDEKPAGE